MLACILLFWIGLQLNAPTWYWWVFGAIVLIKIIQFGFSMFKAGRG